LFGASAEGSRGLLQAIAASMITVAGVSFSITVVAIALAASQYSSRLVGNFMRDRANQLVLGVFVGVFVYCLLVLRTIREQDSGSFVPSLAVFTALVLSLVAVGCLIFFIHHVAASIQASSIIQATARAALDTIDRLFPDELEDDEADAPGAADSATSSPGHAVGAPKTGYIQAIDLEALVKLARKRRTTIRTCRRVGDFVVEGSTVLLVADQAAAERDVRRLQRAFAIGQQRTIEQDVAYGIRQIVDVAVRALSPAINDETTAIHCLDYLAAIVGRLGQRRIAPRRRQEDERMLLVVQRHTFEELLREACDDILRSASGKFSILRKLLSVLHAVAEGVPPGTRLSTIERQAERVRQVADRTLTEPEERGRILIA
jgi:uncharacterized membrane protein